MATAERSDAAWVAHEINALVLKLAEKLEVQTGTLKSHFKKVAQEWPDRAGRETGCPQAAYLSYLANQAALAALLYPTIEPLLQSGDEGNPRVELVRAVCGDAPRVNDWSSLEKELWATLERPDLPTSVAEEVAIKLEVIGSERVLIDRRGAGLTALRPRAGGPGLVYYVDPATCRQEADDLVEWLGARVEKL
jgi:hypothetical protein